MSRKAEVGDLITKFSYSLPPPSFVSVRGIDQFGIVCRVYELDDGFDTYNVDIMWSESGFDSRKFSLSYSSPCNPFRQCSAHEVWYEVTNG